MRCFSCFTALIKADLRLFQNKHLFVYISLLESMLLTFIIITALSSTGQVTDLKGHFVTQVAMGKAHTCVLTKTGEVWTFGVNNKGQCGRDTGSMSQAGKGEKIIKTNTLNNILHIVFFFLILSLYYLRVFLPVFLL